MAVSPQPNQRHLPPGAQQQQQQAPPYLRRQTGSPSSKSGTPRRAASVGGSGLPYDASARRDIPPAYQLYGVPSHLGSIDTQNIDPILDPNTRGRGPPEYGALSESPQEHPSQDSGSESGLSRSPTPEAEGLGDSTEKKKRERACDSCRGLKVKCIRDGGDTGQPCKRCAKAKRSCITTPSTRKRQSHKAEPRVVALLETRVQELERTIHSLRTHDGHEPSHNSASPPSLGGTPNTQSSDPDGRARSSQNSLYDPPWPRDRTPRAEGNLKKRKIDESAKEKEQEQQYWPEATTRTMRDGNSTFEVKHIPPNAAPPKFDHSELLDTIDALVDRPVSDRVFRRYVEQCLPIFPALAYQPSDSAESARESKPILFLTILACNSQGLVGAATQLQLLDCMRDVFADCQWRKGEKTLEIMQSYHVASMCYRPPAHFSQANFFQLSVLALVMGIELGLGRRMDTEASRVTSKMHGQVEGREGRRAWLVSYYLCISISMMLRRPLVARFSRYEDECIRILGERPNAADRLLIQHVKLAHLWEEIFTEFKFHDPKASATMEDRKVVAAVKLFNERLDHIMDNVPEGLDSSLLQYGACSARINIHEVSLYQSKNQEIFWPPLFDIGIKHEDEEHVVFNNDQITSMLDCLTASHKLLDLYLGFSNEKRQFMPAFFTVRATYALVMLVKLYRASRSTPDIRRYMKPEDLQLDRYLADVETALDRIIAADPVGTQSKFILVVRRLKGHYERMRDGPSPARPDAAPEGSTTTSRSSTTTVNHAPPSSSSASHQTHPVADPEGAYPAYAYRYPDSHPPPHQHHPHQQQQQQQQQQRSYPARNSASPLHALSELAMGPAGAALDPSSTTRASSANPSAYGGPLMPPPHALPHQQQPQHHPQQQQQQQQQQLSAPHDAPLGPGWYLPSSGYGAYAGTAAAAAADDAGDVFLAPHAGMDVDAAALGVDGLAFMQGMWGGAGGGPAGYEGFGGYGFS